MKKFSTVFMSLLLVLGFTLPGYAADVSPYTYDFNTTIDTNDHEFKLASNWGHVAPSKESYYGGVQWVTYSYHSDQGRDDSGCLEVYQQKINYDYVSDFLITPVVWGEVSLWVKAVPVNKSSASLYIYKYNASTNDLGATQVSKSSSDFGDDWIQVTLNIPESDKMRLCIKGQYLYMDDFSAEHADIVPEKILKIKSLSPNDTTGTLYWAEKEDNTVDIKFTNVTVENLGDVDLTVGDEDFTLSLVNNSNNNVLGEPVNIPQNLAVGETSDPFEVTFNVPYDKFNYNTTLLLREDCSQSYYKLTQSQIISYQVKFIFNAADAKKTVSLSDTDVFGIVSEAVTKNYELRNDGGKPMVVKSVNVPEGFTLSAPAGKTLPEGEFTLNYNEKQYFNITMTDAPGDHSGDFTIVYVNTDNEETTYTLPLSGTVIGENTFVADFNDPNRGVQVYWPYGSIAERNVSSDKQYVSMDAGYNTWLKGLSLSGCNDAENKFITPKLHANAGDKLSFTVGRLYSDSNATFAVYTSTDREEWGEPLMSMTKDDISYATPMPKYSITFDQAGDYYVGFALYGGTKLDDIVGLEQVAVDHDLYIKAVDQKESMRSGIEETFSVDIIPCTDEAQQSYSVKLIFEPQNGGDNIEYAIPESSLDKLNGRSGTTNKKFSLKAAPEVESTTKFNTYWKFEFDGGATFTTPVKEIIVTFEPEFLFVEGSKSISDSWKPDSFAGPLNFGKINANTTKEFKVYNYGLAPLTVKSVVCPEGFSSDFESEAVVAGKESLPVNITALATEEGEYTGNVVITYVDADGADATHQFEVNSSIIDPNKWYVNFDNGTSNGVWPKGAVFYGLYPYCHDYTNYNCAYYTNGTTGSFMITPKMNIAANDELAFVVKAYSSWTEGSIEVYYADSRDKIKDTEKRSQLTPVLSLSSKSENEATKFDNNSFKEFKAKFPVAGEYYVGIVIKAAYIDDLLGLSPMATEGLDLELAAANFPVSLMQNNAGSVDINLYNFGPEAVSGEDYKVSVYLDGNEIKTVEGSDLPTNDSYTINPSKVTVPFRAPLVGTYPMYAKISAADGYELITDSKDVEFTKEIASSEVQVGDNKSRNSSAMMSNYNSREEVSIYTPEYLGLNGGDKIASIAFKGYYTGDTETDPIVGTIAYKFVDEFTSSTGAGEFDLTGFTKLLDGVLVNDEGEPESNVSFTKVGSDSEIVDMLSFVLDEPIVYEEGKTLVLYTMFWAKTWQDTGKVWIACASATDPQKNYYRQKDGTNTAVKSSLESASFQTSYYIPTLYLGLAIEPTFVTGNVTDNAGAAVENADVVLISTDGENVQYRGATDENGAYAVQVIQTGRKYHTYAITDGKKGLVKDVDAVESDDVNLTVYDLVKVNTETAPVDKDAAYVEFDLKLKEGYNAIVLPFSLDNEEILDIFGENAKVYELFSVEGNTVKFQAVTRIKAATPCLVVVDEENAAVDIVGKAMESRTITDGNMNVRFRGTYTAIPKADNHYIPNENLLNGIATADNAAEGEMIAPYSAYLESNNGPITMEISDVVTAIEGIDADDLIEVEIYDLNGLRVKNPKGGIYIVNGKKTVLN